MRDLSDFGSLVQLVVVPVLVASGMAMWQQPRLRKLLARDRTTPAPQHGGSA